MKIKVRGIKITTLLPRPHWSPATWCRPSGAGREPDDRRRLEGSPIVMRATLNGKSVRKAGQDDRPETGPTASTCSCRGISRRPRRRMSSSSSAGTLRGTQDARPGDRRTEPVGVRQETEP